MPDTSTLLLFLAIAGGVTLLSRELPFLLFGSREIPGTVLYLGKVLPMAIMCILVLYCIKDVSFVSAGGFVPQLAALAFTVCIHLWRRNTTLSIFCGTACYMILIRLI